MTLSDMTQKQKKRIQKVLAVSIILLVFLFIYYLIVTFTDIGISCFFHSVTGWHCPGCGASRMFIDLLRGNILSAAKHNLLLFFLLPFAAVFIISRCRKYILYDKNAPFGRIESVFIYVALGSLLLFGVLRNLPFLSFLAP